MAIIFPNTPTVGQVVTQGGTSYTWTGASWDVAGSSDVGYTGSRGSTGYTGSIGVGYTGSTGSVGYTGSIGTIGFTGSAGAAGAGGVTSFNSRTGAVTLTKDDITNTISLTAGTTYQIMSFSGSTPSGVGAMVHVASAKARGNGTVTVVLSGVAPNYQPYNVWVYAYKNGVQQNGFNLGTPGNTLQFNMAVSNNDTLSIYMNSGPGDGTTSTGTMTLYTNSDWYL